MSSRRRRGLEQFSADLNFWSAMKLRAPGDPMVEIRVAVADAARAHGLLRRLVELFNRSAVSWDATRNEVRVRSDWESRSVTRVIDAVESWLAADGGGSVQLSIGGSICTIVAPTYRSSPRGQSA
jgi:hypothetical protein